MSRYLNFDLARERNYEAKMMFGVVEDVRSQRKDKADDCLVFSFSHDDLARTHYDLVHRAVSLSGELSVHARDDGFASDAAAMG
ncbi:MAG: hypothetical protein K0S79_114 [Nitrospira sp.]|jgi:hypothetical protein|nr:hypothetical protein [Nitrospira sp.]